MRRILFVDRDDTIIFEPKDNFQVDSFEKLRFLPGAITALANIAKELSYELVMVSNQDGLGTQSLPESKFFPPHNLMLRILEDEGVKFSEILIDRSLPQDCSNLRKPRTGLVDHYRCKDVDLGKSIVIGDRSTDVEFARNLGTRSIQLRHSQETVKESGADYSCQSWNEILSILRSLERSAQIIRKTRETSVEVDLILDGQGKTEVQTGLGFFDHMLEQIGKHAGFDLKIITKGDLYVDEHHTIEDTGIALGAALKEALNDMSGIERFGFLLPMDEAITQIALDLSGRPYLVWDVELKREKIGDVPCEMFEHFFRSLVDQLRCTLNIKAQGANDHHIIESVFKGLGRVFKDAVRKNYKNLSVPSTKGTLIE